MIGGIYAILNLVNDKIYVGSAKSFYNRFSIHKSTLKNNKHDNSYLQHSWNKYGQLNFIFVILELVENETDLEAKEQHWINILKPYDKSIGYNHRTIANNNTGIFHTQKTKDKISKTKSGIRMSDEAKDNMSRASANRDKCKWPCAEGSKCKCKSCKEIHRIRNREHAREWREWNREHYNKYMRDQRAKAKSL